MTEQPYAVYITTIDGADFEVGFDSVREALTFAWRTRDEDTPAYGKVWTLEVWDTMPTPDYPNGFCFSTINALDGN